MTESGKRAVERRRYTTKAVNTGGRNGVSRLIDGSYEVKVSKPAELGGDGGALNPEQLFALGWSACFHSALERHMGVAQVEGESKIGIEVGLNTDPDLGGFKLNAHITVGIEGVALDQVKQLADLAHGDCAYSKAVRGNIEVTVEVLETFLIEDVAD